VTPLIAIVGRPNVGKSTLFNRLTGSDLAIVHDVPGVTRDRHYADAHLWGREVTLIDTGGFDPTTDDPMGQGIARHVRAAIDEADVIVCVLDAKGPPTEPDRAAVELLRKSGRPVIYAANKVDNDARALQASELYGLGIHPVVLVSALHGRGTHELLQAITQALPATPDTLEEPVSEHREHTRLALIGRPNAGKSSLLNLLAGTERSLVDDKPGTTRDPVDTRIEYAGRSYTVVDTAGIRRRSKVDAGVEAASVMRSIRAVARAQVIVLMCDAAQGVAEQDARLLGLCLERKRAVIVGLNKMDLLAKAEQKRALDAAKTALHFARWTPYFGLSAKSGDGVSALMKAVDAAAADFMRRVSTGELNRFFERVLERTPPPTKGGRAPRIYYITQARTAPPVFVAMCSAPHSIAESYKRFVSNQIRQEFGFGAVPIVVEYRERTRRAR
jgi:GTPase